MLAAIERILITLWVGALWSVGYLAVPVLFASLDDRVLAGALAGRMFTLVSAIGIGCGGVLLGSQLLRDRFRPRWRSGLLCAMLALVAVGAFVLQPWMAGLKTQGIGPGTAQAAEFARLHGVAAALYLVNSLCGLVLVAAWPGDGRGR